MWLLLLACAPTPASLGVAGAPHGAAPHGASLPHRAPPGPALDPGARDEDGDGHVAREDCDDADPAVHVGVAEVGDGRDQDCDGQVDEGLDGVDEDGDGWSAEAGDPDDADATRHPGAAEVAGDGVDQNGDGSDAGPALSLGRADLVVVDVDPFHAGMLLGFDVSLVDDMDGDGVGEVAIRGTAMSEPWEYGGDGVGETWVFDGRLRGAHGANGARFHVPDDGWFESSWADVRGGGDLDGDGLGDVVVGMHHWSGGEDHGGWLGYFGGAGPWERRMVRAKGSLVGGEGNIIGYAFGLFGGWESLGGPAVWYMSYLRDDDIGRVRVRAATFPRGQMDDAGVPEVVASTPGDNFGARGTDADLDGDGIADLAVSAWGDRSDRGAAYLIPGPWEGSTVVDDVATAVLRGEVEGANGGEFLSAGDGDGDGYADLAVAAPRDDTNGEVGGWVGVFRGPLSGEHSFSEASVQVLPEGERQRMGTALALDGDLDGSGVTDLVIGVPLDPGRPGPGRVHLFFDARDGVYSTAESDGVLFGTPGDIAGWSLASGKDLDHDGLDDLVVGAPMDGTEVPVGGKAYVWSGASLIELLAGG